MNADDVKTLREAAFACTIRYANTHMSTNDRLYFDAIKICFNRVADIIEREERDRALMFNQVEAYSYDQGWDAALAAAEERMRIHQSKWQAGSVFFEHFTDAIRDVRTLRREPRT